MKITHDLRTAVTGGAKRGNQHHRINLEMASGIVRHVRGHRKIVNLAGRSKQKAADLDAWRLISGCDKRIMNAS